MLQIRNSQELFQSNESVTSLIGNGSVHHPKSLITRTIEQSRLPLTKPVLPVAEEQISPKSKRPSQKPSVMRNFNHNLNFPTICEGPFVLYGELCQFVPSQYVSSNKVRFHVWETG